jgi:hypothetical protein
MDQNINLAVIKLFVSAIRLHIKRATFKKMKKTKKNAN